jgi:uncharacterized protein (DUF4415 family)
MTMITHRSKGITAELRAELEALAAMQDDGIDTSDMPEVTDFTGWVRGKFYRPIKKQVTLRLDADLIEWFKARQDGSRGYQTAINAALRQFVKDMKMKANAHQGRLLADVRRHDSNASDESITKIVRHLGISLQADALGLPSDPKFIGVFDQTELDRVRDNWCVGELGLDKRTATNIIEAVAGEMSRDRRKSRVTFYYLAAKHAGKLETLSEVRHNTRESKRNRKQRQSEAY